MPFPEVSYPRDLQLNVPVLFQPTVSLQLLEQTRQKLGLARFPDEQDGFGADDWTQGATVGKVKQLAEFWLNQYDWKTQEVWPHPFFDLPCHVRRSACKSTTELTVKFGRYRKRSTPPLSIMS